MTAEEKTTREQFTVSGDRLVEKVKQLIHEGNVRRVRLIYKDKPVFDIPLTLGAFAALVTECTLEVEKVEPPAPGAE